VKHRRTLAVREVDSAKALPDFFLLGCIRSFDGVCSIFIYKHIFAGHGALNDRETALAGRRNFVTCEDLLHGLLRIANIFIIE
jgi:hypothetical protein